LILIVFFSKFYFNRSFQTKATNEVLCKVPKSTNEEMQLALASSKKAFKTWSKTTPLFRQQIMFKFQSLIKDNMVSAFLIKS
jgi:acyl-CoA reductase-like NAD-dependent aldehyde dehydrogenase